MQQHFGSALGSTGVLCGHENLRTHFGQHLLCHLADDYDATQQSKKKYKESLKPQLLWSNELRRRGATDKGINRSKWLDGGGIRL